MTYRNKTNWVVGAVFLLLMGIDDSGCDRTDIDKMIINKVRLFVEGDVPAEGCGCGDCSDDEDKEGDFEYLTNELKDYPPGGLSSCESSEGCSASGGYGCNPSSAGVSAEFIDYESTINFNEINRIENAVQVRMGSNLFNIAEDTVSDIVEAYVEGQSLDLDIETEGGLPYLDFKGKIYPKVKDLEVTPTANCVGDGTDCIKISLTLQYRTCDESGSASCSSAEWVQLKYHVYDTDLAEVFDTSIVDDCKIKLDSSANSADGIDLEVYVALDEETEGPYEGFSRFRILGAEFDNPEEAMIDTINFRCGDTSIGSDKLVVDLNALPWYIDSFVTCSNLDEQIEKRIIPAPEDENTTLMSGSTCERDEDEDEGYCVCTFKAGDVFDYILEELGEDDAFNHILEEILGDDSYIDDGPATIDGQAVTYLEDILPDLSEICMTAESSSDCPSGSTYSSSAKTCKINGSGGRCVGPLMGTGGELTIEAPVSLVSTLPGLDATLSFMAALGGSGEVAANGYNLSMTLGIENLVHDDCVPELEEGDEGYVAAPSGLPRVSAFESNNRPSSSGVSSGGGFGGGTAGRNIPYDVGVAVSEEFLNYALFKMWDAGLMCASVTSAVSSQLSPTTLAALLGTTIKRMIFPLSTGGSYVGMNIRPQQPPEIELNSGVGGVVTVDRNVSLGGVDVTIRLPALYVDLYLWAQDRFVRLLTIATDIEVAGEIGIKEGEEGSELSVTLGEIVLANTEFINALSTVTSDNLSGSETVEGLANGTIPEYIGTISESIPNVAIEQLLNDSLGVPLPIPGSDGYMLPVSVEFSSSSLKAFKDDVTEDMFLGIFVDLNETDGSSSLSALPETRVEITHLSIPEDHGAFEVETWAEGELPYLEIAMSGSGPEGAEYEYSYRTTFTGWSEWSQSAYAMIEDESLVLQQRQKVYARARLKGVRNAADMTPAEAEFEIDVSEPMVEVTRDSTGEGQLQAFDLISSVTEMEYRVQSEDEQWSEWVPMRQGTVALGQIAYNTAVQVRDASGNVATSGNVRGALDVDAPQQSCSVRAPGTNRQAYHVFSFALGVIGIWMLRRRMFLSKR